MCDFCEKARPWGDNLYLSFLTWDRDGWHIFVEEKDIKYCSGMLSPSIEFCPKCGEKLPEEGRGF